MYSKKIRGEENWYLPPPGMQESWGLPQCDVFFPSYLKQNDKNRGVHSCDHCDSKALHNSDGKRMRKRRFHGYETLYGHQFGCPIYLLFYIY